MNHFFGCGGTAWELHSSFKTGKKLTYYLTDRAKKDFNVIQTVILALNLDGLDTPNAYW